MFKNAFFLALTSAILATGISFAYAQFYFGMLVDFSEAFKVIELLSYNVAISMAACFLFVGIHFLLKKPPLVGFITNALLSVVSIALVFVLLKRNDPVLKNEDAAIFIDYYKGFLMPVLFIPFLTWFSLFPLFIKNK